MKSMSNGLTNGVLPHPTPTPVPPTSHEVAEESAQDHASAGKTVRWTGSEQWIMDIQKTSLAIGVYEI